MIWHVKDSDLFCLAISSQLRKHMTHCMFHKKVISDVATWHLPPKHNRRIYTRPPKLSGMSGLVKCNQLHDFIQHKSYYMSSLLETQQRSLSQCSERPGFQELSKCVDVAERMQNWSEGRDVSLVPSLQHLAHSISGLFINHTSSYHQCMTTYYNVSTTYLFVRNLHYLLLFDHGRVHGFVQVWDIIMIPCFLWLQDSISGKASALNDTKHDQPGTKVVAVFTRVLPSNPRTLPLCMISQQDEYQALVFDILIRMEEDFIIQSRIV